MTDRILFDFTEAERRRQSEQWLHLDVVGSEPQRASSIQLLDTPEAKPEPRLRKGVIRKTARKYALLPLGDALIGCYAELEAQYPEADKLRLWELVRHYTEGWCRGIGAWRSYPPYHSRR